MDAKILPFARRNDQRKHGAASDERSRGIVRPPVPVLPAEYGSGWYHDAAIRDHDRSLRHED